jgi:hypothetical protein
MRGTLVGLGITGAIWAALIGAYSLIELVRGNVPFAMLHWEMGGKFVTIVILCVLGLGAAIGYSSDQVRRKMGR